MTEPQGTKRRTDIITPSEARTLVGLFERRVERCPSGTAYRQYDPLRGRWQDHTWLEVAAEVARWQQALAREGLSAGERVAVQLRNGIEWVCFDQAALSLGLVVVPLYTDDTLDNVVGLLGDSGARLLLAGDEAKCQAVAKRQGDLPLLRGILHLERGEAQGRGERGPARLVSEWLGTGGGRISHHDIDPYSLATIVYTSGTSGRPKGVMLSHSNILRNAEAVLKAVPGYPEDVFLSFLPLSHMFERTVGYYLPMMAGCTVAYARSARDLPEDLQSIRPTVLVSVPRIYERVYSKVQRQVLQRGRIARALLTWTQEIGWRRFGALRSSERDTGVISRLAWPFLRRLVADRLMAALGGRLRVSVSGGAPLSETVSRFFVALGLPLLQGYGLTEASPVVSTNRIEDNLPASVGRPLPGVEVRIGEDGEVLVRSPSVMQGYWGRPDETRKVIDERGWLHTGDLGEILDGRLFIRGRIKEIMVTSTGEKVAPSDMEAATRQDPLFEQVMVLGEGMPYVAALAVLNRSAWRELSQGLSLDPDDPASLVSQAAEEAAIARLTGLLTGFPGYARVRAVRLLLEPWTIEAGLLTPTMKLKRQAIEGRFAKEIRALYAGHAIPT